MKCLCTRRRGPVVMILGAALILPALLALFACTLVTDPDPDPGPTATLLVTNATCDPGPCSTFWVRGFWTHQPVATPGGRWNMVLGAVSTETACLTVPGADTFRVNDVPYLWTSHDSLSLGIENEDYPWPNYGPKLDPFVPANSPGWSVTLPGGTEVTPTDACG